MRQYESYIQIIIIIIIIEKKEIKSKKEGEDDHKGLRERGRDLFLFFFSFFASL